MQTELQQEFDEESGIVLVEKAYVYMYIPKQQRKMRKEELEGMQIDYQRELASCTTRNVVTCGRLTDSYRI